MIIRYLTFAASVSAGKAYYAYFVSGGQTITKVVFTPSSGAKSFEMEFDDEETTAIEEVETTVENNAVYSIRGERIYNTDNLPKGIYIKNGKKFMVK